MQLPRDVRELARFAADAINAYMRGQSIPAVALHYRYEPITAITTLRHLCSWYGRANDRQGDTSRKREVILAAGVYASAAFFLSECSGATEPRAALI
jgi:hypothetical protein